MPRNPAIKGPHSRPRGGFRGGQSVAVIERDSTRHAHEISSAEMWLEILLVDANPTDVQRQSRMLRREFGEELRIHVARSAAEALAILDREPIDLALVEYQLPDADGLGLLASIAARRPETTTILVTSHGNEQVASHALQLGARDYLAKSDLDAALLGRAIRRATRLADLDVRRERLVEQLEQSHRDMDHFVRALSHDMTAIFMLLDSSFSQLKETVAGQPQRIVGAKADLAAGPLAERFAHVEACLRESKRFLDDLVTLARTGIVQMDPECVDLTEMVAEVLFEQRELLAARGVQTTVAADLPVVWCNAGRAKQVFTNLLRNVAKHGCEPREPRITISQRTVAGPDGLGRAEITLRDNGPGIPPASREEIFLPGHRLPTAHPDGTGMGLSIVKKIVDYYGGEVFVDPGCALGTAIVFTMPLPPA